MLDLFAIINEPSAVYAHWLPPATIWHSLLERARKLRVKGSINQSSCCLFVLQSMEPSGGSKYDPVYGLLKEATVLQVWLMRSARWAPLPQLLDAWQQDS